MGRTAEEHYWAIHEEIKALHKKKGADYGETADPFANLRAAEAFGLAAHHGVALRMEDKIRRLRTFYKKGALANESVEDAFLDMANYAMLGLALFREQRDQRDVSREVGFGPVAQSLGCEQTPAVESYLDTPDSRAETDQSQ